MTTPQPEPKIGVDDFLSNGHSLQDALTYAVPLDDAGLERPVPTGILANSRQLPKITQEALAALVRYNNPPKLFVKDGAIVRPRLNEKGAPVIDLVGESLMLSYLALASDWQRYNRDGTLSECFPPLAVAKDILSGAQWPFPPLAGVVQAPVLREDWTILNKAGYDAVSRLIYWPSPGLKIPAIPESPNLQDALASKEFIQAELLRDFLFADAASYANGWAGLLTPLQQNAAPIELLDAPEKGSGKTLLASLSGIIATGRAVLQAVPTDSEEWRKAITSTLLSGERVVIFDNLEKRLDSHHLARVLTAGVWSDRLLGRSQIVQLSVNSFWYATGNNVALGGDMPRRAIKVRLDPKMPRPWLRTGFRHPDLEDWALEHRGEILAALLTILRAWHIAGHPEADTPVLGSFGVWSRAIGGVLDFVGIHSFLGNLPEVYEEADTDTPQWENFFTAWHEELADAELGVKELGIRIRNSEPFRDAIPDILRTDLDDMLAERKNSFQVRLGNCLRDRFDVVYPSGVSLRRAGKDSHTKAALWQVKVAEGAGSADSVSSEPTAHTGARTPENEAWGNDYPQPSAPSAKPGIVAAQGPEMSAEPDSGAAQTVYTPFIPTNEWQDVPPDSILPNGCEIRIDLATGRRQAKWDAKGKVSVHICGACGGHDFWQRITGEWVCGVCHPDPRTLGRDVP